MIKITNFDTPPPPPPPAPPRHNDIASVWHPQSVLSDLRTKYIVCTECVAKFPAIYLPFAQDKSLYR